MSKNRIGNHSINLLNAVATFRGDDDTVGFIELLCLQREAHIIRTTALSSSFAIA